MNTENNFFQEIPKQEISLIQNQTEDYINKTTSMSVVTHDQYLEAGDHLKKIKLAIKKVKELFEGPKKHANDAHKSICSTEREFLKPLQHAEKEASQKVSIYLVEEKKKRDEENRRLQEEAEEEARKAAEEKKRQHENEVLKTAELLESQGFKDEADSVLSAEPAPIVEQPVIASFVEEKEKVEGIHTRSSYKIEITDLTLLIQEVAAGRQPATFLLPNEKVLNQMARSLKHELKVPGVKVLESKKTVVRT